MNIGFRATVLTVTLALTSACEVKSAYNNADWLIIRWVNDRVGLEDEQERAVRASIENTLTGIVGVNCPTTSTFCSASKQT